MESFTQKLAEDAETTSKSVNEIIEHNVFRNDFKAIRPEIEESLKMSFTAMGERVNLASRLQSLNKQYGTRILIDEETAMAAKESFAIRQVAKMGVYGHDGVDNDYKIIGIADDEKKKK